ncbi:hypothetical protein JRI60_00235 [Archangium violaceum]|uniref:hypothetical protein n=1 Tax=Archangium violaceum TaxID=83451 RepID=UPI00194E8AAB|nr:hypothetical protein [Archangium violaceum]QRN97559.1 hypothetical protein JRI60_00235 [Archangium violaceum]
MTLLALPRSRTPSLPRTPSLRLPKKLETPRPQTTVAPRDTIRARLNGDTFTAGARRLDLDGDKLPGSPKPPRLTENQRAYFELIRKGPPQREDYPKTLAGILEYGRAKNDYEAQKHTLEQKLRYDELKAQGEPRREDFPDTLPGTIQYLGAKAAYINEVSELQEELGPTALREYEESVTSSTSTGRALLEEAERLGIPVHVLSDAEYAERYPGTGGVTVNGEVYIPYSALEQDEPGVLEHELTHAVLGPKLGSGTDPLDERIERIREAFERIGLDPEDGERLARNTQGWSNGETLDHVQTYVVDVDQERERRGLPPLSPRQRDELYEQAALREAALGLQRAIDEGEMTEEEAREAWARLPQGRAHPAPSNGSFRDFIEPYTDESAVRETAFPEDRTGKGMKLMARLASMRG